MYIKGTKILDLSSSIFGDIKVINFLGKQGKHPNWQVECIACGKEFTMQSTHLKNKVKGKGCGVGCTVRINPVKIEDGVAYVDVSTDTFPDKVCTLSEKDYKRYMTDRKWYCYKDKHSHVFYVFAKIEGKKTRLHHLICKPDNGCVIDHIDGNGLNNCRHNLRSVTHSVNMRNRAMPINNTHGEMGIVLRPSGRYGVYIAGDVKEKLCIGTFDTLEEAQEQRRYQEDLSNTYHENNGRTRNE